MFYKITIRGDNMNTEQMQNEIVIKIKKMSDEQLQEFLKKLQNLDIEFFDN